MVEGHQCHRVAAAHRKLLLNHAFEASSPNGRFSAGAAAIHQRPLRRIEVHGKNLFYFFSHSTQIASAPLLGSSITWQQTTPAALPAPSPAATLASAPAIMTTAAAAEAAGAAQEEAVAGGMASKDPLHAMSASAIPSQLQTSSQQDLKPANRASMAHVETAAPDTPAVLPPRKRVRRASSTRGTPAAQQPDNKDSSPQNGALDTAEASHRTGIAGSGQAQGSSEDDDEGRVVVMRVHFGMSGAFRISTLPGPEATPTTRLMLLNRQLGLVCHLSAMTVEHAGLQLYTSVASKLGPDPLRHDADPEVLWRSMQRSRKPVGLTLMTQEMIAGIGNIYRAEVLFKAGVHPEQVSNSITREQFDRLWQHSVQLLQWGYESGVIKTVDPEDAARLGKPWTRRYVYNQRQCGVCKSPVRRFEMAARAVFCCEKCQPLPDKTAAATATDVTVTANAAIDTTGSGLLGEVRAQETMLLAGSKDVEHVIETEIQTPRPGASQRKGLSMEELKTMEPARLTVAVLKATLSSLCMSTFGRKADLVLRLSAAIQAAASSAPDHTMSSPDAATPQLTEPTVTAITAHTRPSQARRRTASRLDDEDLASRPTGPTVRAPTGRTKVTRPAKATTATPPLIDGEVLAPRARRRRRSTASPADGVGPASPTQGVKRSRREAKGGQGSAAARVTTTQVTQVTEIESASEDEVDRAEALLAAGLGVPS